MRNNKNQSFFEMRHESAIKAEWDIYFGPGMQRQKLELSKQHNAKRIICYNVFE